MTQSSLSSRHTTRALVMHRLNFLGRLLRSPRFAPLLLLCTACNAPSVTSLPATETVAAASPYRSAAFVLDVNTRSRTVKISPPVAGASFAASMGAASFSFGNGAHASLLGADAIEMRLANYAAGTIGAVVPGKIRITFDLSLVNRLNSVELGTPTFPVPPAGVTGVQAFPFELSVLSTPGVASSGGNEILVTSPSFGKAMVSDDWDGEPHSFFNDASCTGGSNDCFRYEPFGTISAGGVSAPRKVGFLVDPTVRDVRIRLLVAADLRAAR